MTYSVPISAKGIVFDGDSVWLRKNEREEWELPGGKMDEGEQPEETVIRELREELGFVVQVKRLVHVYSYKVDSTDETKGVLVLIYFCKLIKKVGEFEIDGEAGEAEFKKFTPAEIEILNMPEFYKEAVNLTKDDEFLGN